MRSVRNRTALDLQIELRALPTLGNPDVHPAAVDIEEDDYA
jgi:hypothetical protein